MLREDPILLSLLTHCLTSDLSSAFVELKQQAHAVKLVQQLLQALHAAYETVSASIRASPQGSLKGQCKCALLVAMPLDAIFFLVGAVIGGRGGHVCM